MGSGLLSASTKFFPNNKFLLAGFFQLVCTAGQFLYPHDKYTS